MERCKWFVFRIARWMIAVPFLMLWFIQTAEAMVVWTDHATVKIRREMTITPPKPGQTTATLKAARNEFESFQLVVSADQGNLSGVNVSVSDLIDARGNRISGGSIMIYKEAFINVTTRSTTEGSTGYWPDALIPKKDGYAGEVRNAFPFSVVSGRNQPVWIEIYVPQGAAAGVYTGSATVTATNQAAVVIPIELTVWNFTLPSTSSLKSAYTIDYHQIPKGHGLGSNFLNQLDLVKTYGKANLLHRITSDFLPGPQVVPGDWDGWSARFGPLMNGTEPFLGGKLPGAKMTAYRMSFSGHETDVPFIRNLVQNAEKRGWADRLFQYTLDEPRPDRPAQWQTIKNRVTALHRADPRLRALVTTSIQGAADFGITQCASPRRDPCIDIFTPTIRFMDNKLTGRTPGGEIPGGANTVGNQRSKYGPEVWWYQACGSHGCGIMGGGSSDPAGYHTGWPAYLIDLPAMFSRVMQWQSFQYNVQGELYYDMIYAYGKRDPWVSQFDFGGNGDGTLYYPGTPAKVGGTKHIPIESIRLKLLREGMEDYEYMNLLAKMGEGAYALQQTGSVVTNTYTWSRKPLDFYAVRQSMALRILSLGGGTTPPDPTPTPDPAPNPTPTPDPAGTPDTSLLTAVITSTVDETDPLLVEFSGTGSHALEGAIADYEWNLGDGGSGSDPAVDHRYTQPGTYKVTLKVTDEAGHSATTSFVLTLTGLSDMPVAQWSVSPADSPLIYTFDGSQSIGGEGPLVQFEWDFGDSSTATGATVAHEYKTPGSYEVKLKVTDGKGKSTIAAQPLQAGDHQAPILDPSPSGGGGGCAIVQGVSPTDFRQVLPTLLIFFAPFWGRMMKWARRIFKI